METTFRIILELFWDTGKYNGNYCLGLDWGYIGIM